MKDQKTLIEDLICFGSRYGRTTISQLKERVALLESARAKEVQTADAMIGLEKAARDELERFKKDWSVLRSESGVLDRENKNLRADLERVQAEAAATRKALETCVDNLWDSADLFEDGQNGEAHEYVAAGIVQARSALSGQAGADLLAELKRLKEVESSKPSTTDWAFCPRCGGSLDTGWECVKCRADWRWVK